MDIVFIFEVILSLLALVFAYNALAGEYERGTLRLVLTHPVRRGHILLAKYISAMLCRAPSANTSKGLTLAASRFYLLTKNRSK